MLKLATIKLFHATDDIGIERLPAGSVVDFWPTLSSNLKDYRPIPIKIIDAISHENNNKNVRVEVEDKLLCHEMLFEVKQGFRLIGVGIIKDRFNIEFNYEEAVLLLSALINQEFSDLVKIIRNRVYES